MKIIPFLFYYTLGILGMIVLLIVGNVFSVFILGVIGWLCFIFSAIENRNLLKDIQDVDKNNFL